MIEKMSDFERLLYVALCALVGWSAGLVLAVLP